MKQWIIFLLMSTISIGMLNGCGPSEEEKRRAEQARQDSLEQVRQQQLEQQRKDSIAQARADSLEAEKEAEEEKMDVNFDPDGAYSVQVEAWRSEQKAESQVDKWVERGFDNAFVVQYGQEETGDVWFRVRLGRLASREAAQNLQEQLNENYDAQSWISSSTGS